MSVVVTEASVLHASCLCNLELKYQVTCQLVCDLPLPELGGGLDISHHQRDLLWE